jgi:hypothetical protein
MGAGAIASAVGVGSSLGAADVELPGRLVDWLCSATNLRHVFLLMVTWMLARAVDLLQTIVQATKPPKPAAAAAAAAAAKEALPAASGGETYKAGASLPQRPAGSTGDKHAWCEVEGSNFRVRCGPNYPKNGKKDPSGPALAKVVAMDLLYTKQKVTNLMSHGHIELPEPTPGWSEAYPELFIINQMLPLHYVNSLWPSAEQTEGETMNLILYARLPPGLGDGYDVNAGDPRGAAQLLKRFLLRADQDGDIAHCFKEIGVVKNTEQLAEVLPSSVMGLLKKFNGKPILTRTQHYWYRDPKKRFFAVDLDCHQYMYATRTGVAKVYSHLDHLEMNWGLVVEARKEEQMPEQVCTAIKLMRIDGKHAMPFPPGSKLPDSLTSGGAVGI